MPKKAINYANCKIYRIVCKDFSVPSTYVGHTTDLVQRRATHKKTCLYPSQNGHNCKVYQQIRANGGFDNWMVLLVEDYPCRGYEDAVVRERYWAEQFEADLNSNVPGRTIEEWQEDTREHRLDFQREYNSLTITCDCGSQYRRGNKTNHLRTKKHRNFISSQCITTDAETTTDSEENSTL